MPSRKSIHTAKWHRCVEKVSARGGVSSPHAICTASLGRGGTFKTSALKRVGKR